MKLILLLITVVLFHIPSSAQDKSFRILSFTLDGKEVSEYTISYQIGEKQFIPVREGNRIYVPKEVSEANEGTTKFQFTGYTFELSWVMDGYSATDKVKSDFNVGIDNYPFELEILDSKNRKKYKKFKTIYFLQGVPWVLPNSNIIADPVTTIIVKPKSKNRK